MSDRRRKWLVWLVAGVLGVTVGLGTPPVLQYVHGRIHYTIGAACWDALMQFEQFKAQTRLMSPVMSPVVSPVGEVN